MDIPLRVLIIEDSDRDVALEVRALKAAGYQVTYAVAETAAEMKAALNEQAFDIVISDNDMPQFDAPGALAVFKESGLDIPFIIVSGAIGEETAVALMKAGAHDYVMKDRLARLVPAVQKELREAESRKEHKRLEEARRENEAKLQAIFNLVGTGIFVIDKNTQIITEANKIAIEMTGLPKERIIGQICHSLVCPAEVGKCPVKDLGQSVDNSERKLIHADGHLKEILKTVYPITITGRDCYIESFIDITDRKQAEVEARERMKELQALYSLAELAQREGITLEELYKEFANILPKSWLYAEIACARLVISDSEFRTENFAESPWMQAAPIMVNREVVGRIEVGYLEERQEEDEGPFLKEERQLIEAVAEQLGQITERKQAEEKLKDTLESLRKAVNTTIQVMASAVETRDPYTSGHQVRSANLARAIATELGLPPEKIEGIWMAGSIHDVGKLSVPAEILSKPTKLSPIELLLIKEHANRGYEILKGVESSWPLAEIVRQHHERMDGSGYPRNLKGEEILLEARILSVADVVEAMASHRPYRAGLGINATLDEIEKNRGTIYDKTVADACLRLFREKGFKLEVT